MTKITTTFIALLFSLTSLSAKEDKTILMLVTGVDKMTNGKTTGLWLEEFAVPYNAFKKEGFKVEVVTPKGGVAPIDPRSNPSAEQAKAWKEAAQRLKSTKALAGIKADNFDAIFIPGGHGVMFDLATDKKSIKLIQDFDAQSKFIVAVCHGPGALVNVLRKGGTPLVKGKKVATFTDDEERAVKLDKDMPFLLETKLLQLGAIVEKRDLFKAHAVQDGKLITGQNPASSEATAELLIKALEKE